MPQIVAYAKVFRDWEALIGVCTQNVLLVPGVEPLIAELEGLLARAREVKVEQENLTGNRQAKTQLLQELVVDGKEMARKIRYFVRIPLGSRNELLRAFGVQPIRPRRRARAAVPPPATPPE